MPNFPYDPRYSYAVKSALKLARGREYPLLLNSLLAESNWEIITYSKLAAEHNVSTGEIHDALGSSDGACCLKGGKYYIFYNDDAESINSGRQRFTIAHEIGHIVLGHLKFKRNELSPAEYKVLEREANTFARNLLMPVPFPIDWNDIYKVSEFFIVSRSAAGIRLKLLENDLKAAEEDEDDELFVYAI